MGEMVMNDTIRDSINTIPVEHLKDGIYILKIVDPTGRIETRKIVIVK